MSDIPVGSPPVPPGRHAAPGGWYPDPVSPGQERYWDGWQWSRTTRPLERSAPPPPSHVAAPPPAPQNPYAPSGWSPPPGYAAAGPAQSAVATTADGVALAGWWWRVLAMTIDTLIVNVLVVIAAFPVYRRIAAAFSAYFSEAFEAAQAGQPPPAQPPVDQFISQSDQLLLTLVSVGVGLVYIVAFLRWKSATPGKLICGLRVVPVDQGRSREPLALGPALLRATVWVLPGLSAVLLIFRLADVLFPLWHPKRQALHDLAARTQVVRPR